MLEASATVGDSATLSVRGKTPPSRLGPEECRLARKRTPLPSGAVLRENCIEEGDCLLWTGPFGVLRNAGTPYFSARDPVTGKWLKFNPTRVLWEAENGPIPKGKIVYRTCGNCRCLAHLKLGKPGAQLKQRAINGISGHSALTIAKLTKIRRTRDTKYSIELAREARALALQGLNFKQISELTGIGRQTVADMVNGRAWVERAPGASVFNWKGVNS